MLKKISLTLCKFFKKHKISLVCGFLLSQLIVGFCYADGGTPATDLTGIATNIDSATKSMIAIIANMAILAGIGFIIAGFMKFRQHSQNPQQVPLGQAIIPIIVGILLGVLPTVIKISQQSLTGTTDGAKIGGATLISNFGE